MLFFKKRINNKNVTIMKKVSSFFYMVTAKYFDFFIYFVFSLSACKEESDSTVVISIVRNFDIALESKASTP